MNLNPKSYILNPQGGFSLIELLLVISILAILSTMTIGYYRNYAKSKELDLAYKNLTFHLKDVQGKAVNGEDQLKWGIHFVDTTIDYYEIFSTATNYAGGTVIDTYYFPSNVAYSGAVSDIIFDRITGTTSANTVTIISEGSSKTVTITAQGNIY